MYETMMDLGRIQMGDGEGEKGGKYHPPTCQRYLEGPKVIYRQVLRTPSRERIGKLKSGAGAK